jgi:transposase
MDKLYLGVDVSKRWLDVAIHGGSARRIANDAPAIAAWLDSLAGAPVALVAFEPTGGYERTLTASLRQAALPFARVHPNEVTAFRARRGVKAKTDARDARLLAEFAQVELAPRGRPPQAEGDAALRALTARRRQLVESLQAERCRAALADSAIVRQTHDSVIAALAGALDTLDAAIAAHVRASPELAERAACLQTLIGVGPITAHTLLGELPELGQRSGKEIAALVGLAPRTRQSGTRQAQARTGQGRPGVRGVLFNAARAAIRWNPVLRDFYQRLVTVNRRPGKVALVAVMRKLLVTLNAIARDRQPWKHAAA